MIGVKNDFYALRRDGSDGGWVNLKGFKWAKWKE
jgi:hypothetical protein